MLTATITSGPEGAFLSGTSANFVNGMADFTNLTVSHPGSYVLTFSVTYPLNSDFSVMTERFTAESRQLTLRVSTQPRDGNTTFILYPYPAVQLVHPQTNEVVTEHTWRNRRWFVTANVQHSITLQSLRSWNVPLMNGEARFTEILVPNAGTYRIVFTINTDPTSSSGELPQSVPSNTFTVRTLPVTRIIVIYDVDFRTVIGSDSTSFITQFMEVFSGEYPTIEIYNTTLTEGSLIVSFFATTQRSQDLARFVVEVTSNFQALSFTFNGQILIPSNITQDPAYSIVVPTLLPATVNHLVLILATTIPSGTILIATILLIVVVILCRSHHKRSKVVKIQVKPVVSNPAFEERYVEHNKMQHAMGETDSMDEYFLVSSHKVEDPDTQSLEGYEMADLNSPDTKKPGQVIVSQKIKVTGTTFSNPYAAAADKVGQLDIESSIDKIWNANSNTNNNNMEGDPDHNRQAFMHLPNVVAHPWEEAELATQLSSRSASAHSSKNQEQ